jgi:uncharacterized membrane protein
MAAEPNSTEDSNRNLERLTRGILLISIVILSGFIVYNLVKPSEEFVQFSIFNDQQQMGNYPTTVPVGTNVTFYFQVQNFYRTPREYQVRIYRGSSESIINPQTGVQGAVSLLNLTRNMHGEETWLSEPINVSFPAVGDNQFIGLELWEKTNGEFRYIPTYVLFLRLNVTASV